MPLLNRSAPMLRQITQRLIIVFFLAAAVAVGSGVMLYRTALDKAARLELQEAVRFYQTRLAELMERRERRAAQFRAQMEFARVLEGSAGRESRLAAYLAHLGSDADFRYLLVTDPGGQVLARFGDETAHLPNPFPYPSDRSAGWFYLREKNRLFQVLRQRVRLGDEEGEGMLLLFLPIDHALIYRTAGQGDDLTLSWQGRPVVSSLGEGGVSGRTLGGGKDDRLRQTFPWGQDEAYTGEVPTLELFHHFDPLLSPVQVGLAGVTVFVALFVIIWWVLGSWLVRLANAAGELSGAAHGFMQGYHRTAAVRKRLERVRGTAADEVDTVAQALAELIQQVDDREQAHARTEAALRESDGRYRSLFAAMNEGVMLQDRTGGLVTCNEAAERILGTVERELVGKGCHTKEWQTIHEDGSEYPGERHPSMLALATGRPKSGVMGLRRGGGELVWVLVNSVPLFQGGGATPDGVVTTLTDITPLKKIEDALHENERFLADLIDNSGAVIYAKDLRGAYQLVNRKFEETTGLPRVSVIGRTDGELFSPASAAEFRRNDLDVMESGAVAEREEVLEGGAERRHLISIKFPVRNEAGAVIGVCGMATDITWRRRAEEWVRASEERLRRIGDGIPHGAIYRLVYPAAGGPFFEYISGGIERILGVTPDAARSDGMNILRYIHPDDAERVRAAEIASMRTLEPFGQSFRSYTAAGGLVWLQCHAMPYRQEDGSFWFDGVVMDVTEQERNREALEAARRQAETASRAKSEFLATMSHEIRTPMNAVLGMLWLVLETPLAPDQQSLLGKAYTSSKALLGILNDILDYSRIEAGLIEIRPHPLRVGELLGDVADLFAAQLEEKGLSLKLELDPALPPTVEGDRLRLAQVLNNLVGNAIKFTERGAIQVRAGRLGEDALWFEVQDTGIGIDPAQAERLFQPFSQADAGITRRYGGTGLGLTICRRLVGLMGGGIEARPAPGGGSIFRFTVRVAKAADTALPIRREDEAATPIDIPQGIGFDGARVLLVEDNPYNQQVVTELLRRRGVAVTVAENGQVAVELAGRQPFDLVLMDIHMPELDGFEASRRIRALPGGADLPIVAITAAVMAADRARCMEVGMAGFVGKPIDPGELIRTLAGLLPHTGSPLPPEDTEPGPDRTEGSAGVLDLREALRRVGGNEVLLRRMLHAFAAEQRGAAAQLDRLLGDGTADAAANWLHRLKGGAANLGATALAAAAGRLEQELRAEGGTATRPAFDTALAATLAALRELFPDVGGVPPRAVDPAALARLLDGLTIYLEQYELVPDEMLDELHRMVHEGHPDPLLARLAHQIDQFDQDGALVTIAQIRATGIAGGPNKIGETA